MAAISQSIGQQMGEKSDLFEIFYARKNTRPKLNVSLQ
jgi:hypothetical protein